MSTAKDVNSLFEESSEASFDDREIGKHTASWSLHLAHKGRALSEAHKDALKGKNKGKRASPETRTKMSAVRTGRAQTEAQLLGHIKQVETKRANGKLKHSQAAKDKVSAANKGRRATDETKAALRAGWVKRKARESEAGPHEGVDNP